MTLARSKAVHRYWLRHPRTDWLKAAQMKYEAPSVPAPRKQVPRGPLPAPASTQPGVRPGTDLLARFGVMRPGMVYRE